MNSYQNRKEKSVKKNKLNVLKWHQYIIKNIETIFLNNSRDALITT